MQSGRFDILRTVGATQFRTACAQNAMITENLDLSTLGAGQNANLVLRALQIRARENLDYEVWLWGTNGFNVSATDPDQGVCYGFWGFAAADAKQIAGAGLYHSYIDGLAIPYLDVNQLTQLHVGLVNRSAAAKSAGDAGALVIGFVFELPLGC